MSNQIFPHFSKLHVENFSLHLDEILHNNLQQIATILGKEKEFTWENLMQPLQEMDNKLERLWSPLSHLHAVMNSPELRKCYQTCLPKLSAYEAAIGHNEILYTAIKALDKEKLTSTQNKIVQDALRSFELSGVALSAEKKKRFEAIQTRLSALNNQFENNILDATQAFTIHIQDEKRLQGVPEHALLTAKELAAEKGLTGWLLTLEFPCYLAVITYAEDRALREEIYQGFITRASDQGPTAHQFDNSSIMQEILALRYEKSQLLGFKNYAEFSLATKMAKSTSQVLDFLIDLINRAHHRAVNEFKRLQDFAKINYQRAELAPWDIAYLSEKKRQALYALSQEDLRPYFPLRKVMQGLFVILNKLYSLNLEEEKGVDIWHPEVKCYCIRDEKQTVRGYIYVDLFARTNKRNGAWMDSFQSRFKLPDGSIQLPIASLNCNFAKPVANKEAMLSHDEVLTLFHEFGHCLHHVLTKVDYYNAAGINGVEWDAVELPSQFFENWCWEKEALDLLTAHIETREALPPELFKKMMASKNFQSALAMLRQLEFSLFDFRIHHDYIPQKPELIANILAAVRQKTTVLPLAEYNRFQHSFSHIFAGGYAAGYYSYKWAEVLSADAFARFEEEGIFNKRTGEDFLHCILEVGGAKKAAEAYRCFRGRDAKVDALLRHNGIQD